MNNSRWASSMAGVTLLILGNIALGQFVTWDTEACEKGTAKAKAAGSHPACVTSVADGTLFLVKEMRLTKVDKTVVFKDGDALIGAADTEVRIEGVVLKKGDMVVRKGGKFRPVDKDKR